MKTLTADVVIVGAGPGGLAAAHAVTAAAPHLKVFVFERSRASLHDSKRGAGLGLDVNGQKALQAINPELLSSIVKMGSILRAGKSMKHDGTLVGEFPFGQGARKEYADRGFKTPCLLGWSDLQRQLAETLPDSVAIHTGMEFDSYETDDAAGTVTTYFKPSAGQSGSRPSTPSGDASQPQPVCVASQLLVAADGYFSRVRRQCLNDGPPEWGGSLVYRARLPASAAAEAGLDLTDCSMMVNGEGRFLMAYPISSGDVVWTAGISDEKLQELGLDSQAIRQQLYTNSSSKAASETTAFGGSPSTNTGVVTDTPPDSNVSTRDYTDLQAQGYSTQETAAGIAAKTRCLQALTGFWDAIQNLVQATPATSLVEHGVYTRPASTVSADSFGKGRVVIIGDAAHPVRPTGQGLNQTCEDAWGLGKVLKDCGVIGSDSLSSSSGQSGAVLLEQLQAYREQRAERVRPIVAHTSKAGKAAYSMGKGKETQQAAATAAAATAASAASAPPAAATAAGPAAAAPAAKLALKEPGSTMMTAEEFTEYCCSVEFEGLAAS